MPNRFNIRNTFAIVREILRLMFGPAISHLPTQQAPQGKGLLTRSTVPPLPTLTWNRYSWSTKIRLPSWSGFQSRGGSYGSVDRPGFSEGVVRLDVGGESAAISQPPTNEMAAAFGYLMAHEIEIAQVVQDAIVAEAQRLLDEGATDPSIQMAAKGRDQLRTLVGLHTIHILETSLDGVAYVGFELGCEWEEEHGLGVMLHRNRVVEVGGAMDAMTEWIAEEDAARQRGEERTK
jgi:hypothetical protein